MEVLKQTLVDEFFDGGVFKLGLERRSVDSERRGRIFFNQAFDTVLQTLAAVILRTGKTHTLYITHCTGSVSFRTTVVATANLCW